MSIEAQKQPIYFMDQPPKGWLPASLLKINSLTKDTLSQHSPYIAQEKRWQEKNWS